VWGRVPRLRGCATPVWPTEPQGVLDPEELLPTETGWRHYALERAGAAQRRDLVRVTAQPVWCCGGEAPSRVTSAPLEQWIALAATLQTRGAALHQSITGRVPPDCGAPGTAEHREHRL